MYDLPNLQALVPQGRADGEARLRAVRAWPGMEIYRASDDMRPTQAGPCGRDCSACEVAGSEEVKEPRVFEQLPALLAKGLTSLKQSTSTAASAAASARSEE